jgi:hypothetical protein
MFATNNDNLAGRALVENANVIRPFEWALGESVNALAPRVKEHALQLPGTVVVYRGRMRVWRDGGQRGKITGWLLRVAVYANFLFPETGEEVDFEIKHVVTKEEDGSLSMSWIRTFQFSGVTRKFIALMRFRPQNGPIVNWHGCGGLLEVELCPRVEGNEIVVISRREWLTLGFIRIPLPGFLKGRPFVREWQEPDGSLHISVEIYNTLLGHIFGYQGIYSRAEEYRSVAASA